MIVSIVSGDYSIYIHMHVPECSYYTLHLVSNFKKQIGTTKDFYLARTWILNSILQYHVCVGLFVGSKDVCFCIT